ncbi:MULTISPECIES: putative transporter [Enterobacter cloacae complex]|uniref:putative transporter n=1 Tax=Enterobacter cloacae complex TaxID=354276 RepID=UPI000735A815|nr:MULTISPECIES: putative transporter [Enterobacter cloacae complex]HAS1740985.1 putative transporter [Enterobacter hormaechei subsp. oharae]ELC6401038.1 putative transporter [Enterobacter hormaechei]KTG97899.1 transporter [Enterobacter hormaechei subsp. xiangfangensis]KTH06789.1 transporter [Enterobacter hormaechei subsp. xiangfangensis]KTI03406.1 transporter [Enterobacter hormaechei subsp. xiangfangensis]
MSDIALTVSVLALVAVVGLWLGNIKIRGVGFGIGGVLFGGIFVGHFADQLGWVLSADMLHFIQEFGLILFVYTIGIQVGPGFFASLRISGLRLNLFAFGIVVMGGLVTAILHKLFAIPLPVVLGIFSGAVTNTPALGAGQQILRDLGIPADVVDQMGMSYAMAYPFGICGILLSMWLVRVLFRVNVGQEAKEHESTLTNGHALIKTINIRVENPNLNNMAIQDVPILNSATIICSRLKRDDTLMVPSPDTLIQHGDLLHLVGQPADLNNARLVIGQEVDTSLSTRGTDMRVERVVVTNEKVLGKKIRDLQVKERYDVVISRLNRAGVELVASQDASLQFGDILNLVGRPSSIDAVADMVGNAQQKLQQVQMLPVFIGVGLGVMLGSIPLYVPGFPVALKLGLAGGPLIMALILGRIGSIGKLYWFMPPSANLALRELGIVLFLAVVGLKSGGDFVDTLVNGEGMSWVGYGIFITAIPLITVGLLARMFAKMNYLTLCGMLAGSMTDPPALAFANNLHATSGAAALSYATVYPLVMFLRIITPQLLAVLFWGMG